MSKELEVLTGIVVFEFKLQHTLVGTNRRGTPTAVVKGENLTSTTVNMIATRMMPISVPINL